MIIERYAPPDFDCKQSKKIMQISILKIFRKKVYKAFSLIQPLKYFLFKSHFKIVFSY